MDSVVEVPPKPLLMWGEAWTEEKLLDRLSENFRLLPFVPIYSPSTTLCRLASPFNVDNRITGLRLIEVTADVLGRKSRRRLHLLVRARARGGGIAVEEYCREAGIVDGKKFRRGSRSASEMVIEWIARHPADPLTTP